MTLVKSGEEVALEKLTTTNDPITRDTLLDGRVTLFQPKDGYRAAIDPVLLAAAVPARDGQRVLDLGTGTGAAALCLAARVSGASVTGLELQAEAARLAIMSAQENGLAGRVEVLRGDLLAPPRELVPGSFDHVMANPPFQSADHGHPPPEDTKAAAHVEGAAGLEDWIGAAIKFVRPKGGVTLVHRADRLDSLLAAMQGRLGEIVIFPLWPVAGRAAKRVLVQGRKGIATPPTLAAGLVLHETGGSYTEEADAVLLRGEALNL